MFHGVSQDLGKWEVGSILVAHQVPNESACDGVEEPRAAFSQYSSPQTWLVPETLKRYTGARIQPSPDSPLEKQEVLKGTLSDSEDQVDGKQEEAMVSGVDSFCLSRTCVFVVRKGTLVEGASEALEAIV